MTKINDEFWHEKCFQSYLIHNKSNFCTKNATSLYLKPMGEKILKYSERYPSSMNLFSLFMMVREVPKSKRV